MNAETVAALRELLGREDVIEAAVRAAWDNKSHGIRAAFAAVLELVADAEADDRDFHGLPANSNHNGYPVGHGPDRRVTC